MSNIIHPKILTILLILAILSFIAGIIIFALAISKSTTSQPISSTPQPAQIVSTLEATKGEIILTPIDLETDEIKIGRDTVQVKDFDINFDLSTIPEKSIINKATLRLYQKDIIGSPYSGNTIQVDDLGAISNNDKLEWKELDITETIKDALQLKQNRIKFNIHLERQAKSTTRDGDFATFESVPQLVVDIN